MYFVCKKIKWKSDAAKLFFAKIIHTLPSVQHTVQMPPGNTNPTWNGYILIVIIKVDMLTEKYRRFTYMTQGLQQNRQM